MGFTVTKIGGNINNANHQEIVCNSRDDIINLPTDPNIISWGSSALVISDSSIWLLDEDFTWKEIN